MQWGISVCMAKHVTVKRIDFLFVYSLYIDIKHHELLITVMTWKKQLTDNAVGFHKYN